MAHSRFTDHYSQLLSIHAVLDLNHILLFLACVSPLVLLGQSWRRGGLERGWRLAAFAVLIVTGVSWMVRPETAGFIGGGAWFALLLLPVIGLRKTAELAITQRFGSARRLVRLLRLVHPADGLLEQSILLQALELAQRGGFASALALLAPLRSNHTSIGRQAIAASFRIEGDWEGLLRWTRSELSPGVMQTDGAVLPLYLRALGEIGSRDELVVEFATKAAALSAGQPPFWNYYSSLLAVLAFCGRVESLEDLLETKLRKLPREVKEAWIGTGEIAAGELAAGRARLEKILASTNDHLLRLDIARRLRVVTEFPPASLSPGSEALLRRLEKNDRTAARTFAQESTRPTPAVLILIALNLAMFIAEVTNGGSMNPFTLHRLGALELVAVRVNGEYWRLLTSLFLHFGPLHLLFNLYALFIIGPGLERAIGAIRFGICYLLSGLGSGIGVLFLRVVGLNSAEQLVGASGCVMGLVGAWAGLLLWHRDSPLAGRRLKNILVIVVIQTAFDLSTPQISMAAHMSGLVTGFALGLLFAPRRAL